MIIKTIILAMIQTAFIEAAHRNSFSDAFKWIASNIAGYFKNAVVYASLVLLFTAVTGSAAWASLGVFAAVYGLGAVSYFKYAARNEPLFFADLLLAFKVMGVADSSNIAITKTMLSSLICGAAAQTIYHVFHVFRILEKALCSGAWARVCLGMGALLAAALFVMDEKKDFTYRKKGFIHGFILNAALYFMKPELYRIKPESNINRLGVKLGENAEKPPEKHSEKPNIIAILSESFFDVTRIEGLRLSAEPLAYYKSLKSRAVTGTLFVTPIGGGTCAVEAEFLTGVTARHFNISKPFYYSPAAQKPFPSLAAHFKEMGYETRALHTFNKTFYNREKVFKNMGFDSFTGLEDLDAPEKDGFYVSDRVLTDMIIESYNSKKGPAFIFGISMENHQPYTCGKYNDTPVKIKNTGISEKLKGEAETYIAALTHADREIKRLAEFVDAQSEPTVLLFFGDHLGAIGPELEFYKKTGYVSGGSEQSAQDTLKLYSPDFFILSNYKTETGRYAHIGANFLSNLLLNYVGGKKPGLYYLLDYAANYARCLSRDDIFIDAEGAAKTPGEEIRELDALLAESGFKAMGMTPVKDSARGKVRYRYNGKKR